MYFTCKSKNEMKSKKKKCLNRFKGNPTVFLPVSQRNKRRFLITLRSLECEHFLATKLAIHNFRFRRKQSTDISIKKIY